VGRIILQARSTGIPLVIDADGLWLITEHPEIITGYTNAVLTPNAREYTRLAEKVLKNGKGTVKELSAALGGVTIVQKGRVDKISNGSNANDGCDGNGSGESVQCDEEGAPRRCGGLGDFLCGTIGIVLAWTEMAAQKAAAAGTTSVCSAAMVSNPPSHADLNS
jgi:ATP-dependent NAD(P)H-hydrate dehydratase